MGKHTASLLVSYPRIRRRVVGSGRLRPLRQQEKRRRQLHAVASAKAAFARRGVVKRSLVAAAAVTGSVLMTAPVAGAMTYTLEPTDLDGVFGIVANVTQQQLGFSLCPCTKIPYPADIVSNGEGVAALAGAHCTVATL